MIDVTTTLRVLFERRLIDPATQCWLWTGARFSGTSPYGVIQVNRRRYQVHRMAAHIYLGFDLDSKLGVLHRCDTPPCFNPAHLFVGTQSDNVWDAVKKGRWPARNTRGERNGGARLTAETVRAIRREYAIGGVSHEMLGDKYGIGGKAVGKIVRRERWKHVEDDPALH